MVEQLTLNQLVRGSSPRGATKFRVVCQSPSEISCPVTSCRRSSMVEHLFCKQAVAGSNPIAGSIFQPSASRQPDTPGPIKFLPPTARWCNGSTNDSDSFCLGSTPSRAANFSLRTQRMRVPLQLMRAVFPTPCHKAH